MSADHPEIAFKCELNPSQRFQSKEHKTFTIDLQVKSLKYTYTFFFLAL